MKVSEALEKCETCFTMTVAGFKPFSIAQGATLIGVQTALVMLREKRMVCAPEPAQSYGIPSQPEPHTATSIAGSTIRSDVGGWNIEWPDLGPRQTAIQAVEASIQCGRLDVQLDKDGYGTVKIDGKSIAVHSITITLMP